MILKNWESLPQELQVDAVRPYYDILYQRRFNLCIQFIMDRILALLLFVFLLPVFCGLAVWIKLDSKGEVFFRQERITRYGKIFRIYKFRTMVKNAEAIGSQVTTLHDRRITKVGKIIRACRLDELPQLINILQGDMGFVGTRPEVKKYVNYYTDEMKATFLLPAGVTSEASIQFKDEDKLLQGEKDVDRVYVSKILPQKMKWNLDGLKKTSVLYNFKMMFLTVWRVGD